MSAGKTATAGQTTRGTPPIAGGTYPGTGTISTTDFQPVDFDIHDRAYEAERAAALLLVPCEHPHEFYKPCCLCGAPRPFATRCGRWYECTPCHLLKCDDYVRQASLVVQRLAGSHAVHTFLIRPTAGDERGARKILRCLRRPRSGSELVGGGIVARAFDADATLLLRVLVLWPHAEDELLRKIEATGTVIEHRLLTRALGVVTEGHQRLVLVTDPNVVRDELRKIVPFWTTEMKAAYVGPALAKRAVGTFGPFHGGGGFKRGLAKAGGGIFCRKCAGRR